MGLFVEYVVEEEMMLFDFYIKYFFMMYFLRSE